MDLKELTDDSTRRHPWETSRLKAVQRILAPYASAGIRVLDVGCGDGFIARNLFSGLETKEMTAVDINLSDELIGELANLPGGVTYRRELPDGETHDLVLLLDILEHVEDDRGLLASLVARQVAPGGMVLITVPVFQSLYSRHDEFLGHHRRYSLRELADVATAGGLDIIASGYLFFSLLLPKFILYKILAYDREVKGVGQWRRGRIVTKIMESVMDMDNRLLMAAGSLGIRIPGLTGWVLCKKPQ